MTTLQITFVSESAGYDNVLGWYNSRTGEAGIIFINTNDDGPDAGISAGTTATIDVEQSDIDAGYIGFFVIPNGAEIYGTDEDSVLNGPLTFDTKGNGDGIIRDADGKKLRGEQGEIIFTDETLNRKNADYAKGDDNADGILGRIAFEDLVKKSDRDFNDLVIDVQVVEKNQPPVVDDQSFEIAENSAVGTVVGQVAASDPDGQPLTYDILSGNESGAFEINAQGEIVVLDPSRLDFEDPALSAYALVVEVTDAGGLKDTALVSIAVTNEAETLAGQALDGYVSGATVFADQNGNGALDAGEVSAITDASGDFSLAYLSGPLVMFGGVDIATGLAFTGVLRAPEGSTVVTPLTTLVAALVDGGQSIADATAHVASALDFDGLEIGGQPLDLLNFDPIAVVAADGADAATAAQVLATGVLVQNTIVQVGALLTGAGGTDAHAAVVAALSSLVSLGTPVNLMDPALLEDLIASAAAEAGVALADIDTVVDDAAQVLAATNAAVADALAAGSGMEVLEALAQAAFVAQGPALAVTLAQAGETNDADNLLSDYTGANLDAKIAVAPIGDVDGGTVGTPGDDVLIGTPGNDVIDGLAGNDQLSGLEGNDRLFGGDGDDVLQGGIGNDFLQGGAGNDVLDGGVIADAQSDIGFRDTDRVDYSTSPGGVEVNLAAGTAEDGYGNTDTLIGIEAVTGSPFDDLLVGTSTFAENFQGGAGDDTIQGGGGFDRADYQNATSGVTIVVGGFSGFATNSGTASGDASVGLDTLVDVEQFTGSDFDDTFSIGLFSTNSLPGGFFNSTNAFEGRGGDDVITGNGATRVEYTSAASAVTVDLAAGTATGDASVGNDTFIGGVVEVRGSSFADTLLGGNPASNGLETFDGRGGNDVIDGKQGWDRADYAFNGPVSIGITVHLAAGTVTGDATLVGTDELHSIEAIRGTHLADLYDASGFSNLSSNAGSSGMLNEFQGMAGDDTIIGNGSTRIAFGLAREGVVVDLQAGTVTGGTSVGNDTILGGVFEVQGSQFDDTLHGSAGNDVLRGSTGNDVLSGGAGSDLLDGGPGRDRADYSGSLDAVSVDLLFGTANDGMGGVDTLFSNVEEVVGTGFNDSLIGNNFDNTLIGGMGNDFLRGGAGFDVLNGGIIADLQSDEGFRDTDRVDYSTALWGVDVNLATGIAFDGEGGVDTLVGIESVNGSMFNDVLTGSDTTFSESFHGGGGDDQIHGGGGFDRAEYTSAGPVWDPVLLTFVGVTINVGGFSGFASAEATVSGDFTTVGFDTMTNVEQFTGSEYADTYSVGWFLSDALPGGFLTSFNAFEGRGGDDTIVGNFNTRVDYTSATGAVTVDFSLPLGQAWGDTSVGTDTLFNVNQVRATSFNDTLLGSFSFVNETFDGRGGDDFIDGRQGFDRADYAFNGPAAFGIFIDLDQGVVTGDPVFTGTDTLRSIESVRATHLADTYDASGFSGFSVNSGSSGTLNEFEGMAGDDIVIGNGNTRLTFGLAREGVTVDLQAGTVEGGASVGNDTISGVNAMRGSSFDDVLMGSNHGIAFAEIYEGRAGNDTFSGRGGFDQARYDAEAATPSGIAVTMATAAGTNIGTVSGGAGIGTDTLIDIPGVVGTNFGDAYDATGYFSPITGLTTFNEFEGLGGNDTITGNGATRVSYISSPTGVTVNLGATGGGFGDFVGSDSYFNVFNVRGSNWDDILNGSSANDTFEGRGGFDTIHGGDGFDLVRYDNGSSGPGTFLSTGSGNFTASAGGHNTDTLTGIESIRGTNFGDLFDGTVSLLGYSFDGRGGDDTLIGSQGFDILLGGDGNDLLRGGQGSDIMNGGLGQDRFDFDHPSEGIDTIEGFEAVPGGDVLDIEDLLDWTSYAGGPLSEFVRLADIFADAELQIDVDGASGPEGWQGLALLRGHAGLDLATLLANGNLDIGTPGGGGVTVIGTPGNDVLEGGPGDDTLIGDLGNDLLIGHGGDDLLDGGIVADSQSDDGFRDTDRVDYSGASGSVNVNLATGQASGADGNDTLIGIEAVNGSMHADTLTGSSAFNEIFHGGAGNDQIFGGGGFDRAEYSDATSTVTINVGGAGNSSATVFGDASVGTDTLVDVETFVGSDWADTYFAGSFSSASLPGGFSSSFNAFEGRGGDDFISGNGNTRVEYTNATGAVTVNLGSGATGDASVGNDSFFGGVNAVRGSSFNDTLLGSGFLSNESFEGRGGDDFINGGQGIDRADYAFNGPASFGIFVDLDQGLVTGDLSTGTDTLRSIEAIRGTHLDDVYDATGFSGFSVNAGSNGMLNDFEGAAGNDTVIGNGNTRVIYGFAREGVSVDLQLGRAVGGASVGTDTIVSGVNGAVGSNFDDVLVGSSGNELLFGNSGNDLLRGGQGFDFLDGGAGSDRFDFDSLLDAGDSIGNFAAGMGGDVLDIADLMISSTTYPGGPFTDYVSVVSMGSDALLQVDPDGFTGIQGWQTVATLIGRAGLTLDFLVSNGNLEVGPGGGGGGVTLIGTPGNDALFGTPGDDTLVGLEGNDFLVGFAGNDLLDGGIVADLQSDIGFRDTDRVDYSAAPGGVNVNLATGLASGADGNDTLIGIESVNGSAFGDVLTGSGAFSENFHGGAGDDFIDGGGGNDRAEYNDATGPVSISLGGMGDASGFVTGDASVGMDTLTGVERVLGSSFADTFGAGWFLSASNPGGFLSGFNSFEGAGGDDQITGNGSTRVEYTNATGAVTVNLGSGATGDASVGADTFFGGINAVRGSSFDDSLTGSGNFNDETFDGRGGNDTINGGVGLDRADYAFNGPAAMGINVNLAAGSVSGDAVWTGTDTLVSVEAVRGTHLDDVYNAVGFSGSGVNPGSLGTLNEFEGMAGNDMVTGNGNTRLTFVSAREGVTVDLAAGTVVGGASVGNDTVSGVNAMRGSNFDDVLMGTNHGTTSAQIYEGRAGNDTFSGRGGFDQAVYISEGAQTGITVDMDAINAFTGTVVGDAAVGTDTLIDIVSVVGTFFNDMYDATGYNSAISTLGAFNEFEGHGGDDTIIGNGSTRATYIGAGAPVTVNLGAAGSASGAFTGTDTLIDVFSVRGSNFDDTLNGSSANDTFEGRGGFDTIHGGDGFDLVRYDNGSTGPGTFISTGSGNFTASAGGHATDTLTGIESIRGTNFGDLFDGTGSFQAYSFDGRGGDDTLIGSVQGDTLLGGDGNDLLRGGQGGDFLDGGLGQDRFDFDDPGHGIDTIAGFEAVPGVDVLDIADLLAFATTYGGGTGGDLSSFVRFENVTGGSQLQIDRDGTGPEGWQGLATLQGHTDLDLAILLSNGNLDVDVL